MKLLLRFVFLAPDLLINVLVRSGARSAGKGHNLGIAAFVDSLKSKWSVAYIAVWPFNSFANVGGGANSEGITFIMSYLAITGFFFWVTAIGLIGGELLYRLLKMCNSIVKRQDRNSKGRCHCGGKDWAAIRENFTKRKTENIHGLAPSKQVVDGSSQGSTPEGGTLSKECSQNSVELSRLHDTNFQILSETFELLKTLQEKSHNMTSKQLLLIAEIKLNISKMQFQEKKVAV